MPSDRHRTHEARHVPHDAARNARFSIGVVNAAYIGIFSVGLQVRVMPVIRRWHSLQRTRERSR